MEPCNGFADLENHSPQNTSNTLLKSFLNHKKQKKIFDFFRPIPYTWTPICHRPPHPNHTAIWPHIIAFKKKKM